MKAPRVTLVMTSFQGLQNLRDFLPRNLEAVRQSPIVAEVVVADDGSSDGSAEWVRAHHPEVKLVALPANRGFGAAANAAFGAASGSHVLNLSNDMVLQPGAVERLMAGFVRDDVFSVSARLLRPDGSTEKGRTIPSFLTGDFKIWKATAALAERPPPGHRLQHFSGAIGLFDRRIFLELAGFDDMYLPFFVEETDLCYRAWKRGYRVLYEPEATVVHHHEESGTILHQFSQSRRRVQFGKNRLLFIWKNIHSPLLAGLHVVNVVARVCFSWLALDFDFYRALRDALARLPEALKARGLEKPLCVRSDRDCFREFRQTLPP